MIGETISAAILSALISGSDANIQPGDEIVISQKDKIKLEFIIENKLEAISINELMENNIITIEGQRIKVTNNFYEILKVTGKIKKGETLKSSDTKLTFKKN